MNECYGCVTCKSADKPLEEFIAGLPMETSHHRVDSQKTKCGFGLKGVEVADRIKAIVDAGIPVCAHIGLTPQSINAFGGHKVQGKTEKAAKKLLEDALAVEKAGAFAVVIEAVPEKLATLITKKLNIVTIGIGAGNGCDGQVLVYQDMLGMFSDFTPKFVKKYANIGEMMTNVFKKYDEEVKSCAFPAKEHTFKIDDDIIEKLY